MLALKENRAALHREVAHLSAGADQNGGDDGEREETEMLDDGHGRVALRCYDVLRDSQKVR